MSLSSELQYRGMLNQTTIEDLSRLDGEPITFYWGVDPSADSMTIGNLAAAMLVKRFINHGHKAVLLIGGATGMIGDPDGKKDERNVISLDQLDINKSKIVDQYRRIFEGSDFKIVDNYDWFKDLGYLQFLREVGKHVPMSSMLDRDFVKSRLGDGGSGISYAEFSYSLIQGYDFYHLHSNEGVTLQLCGADQWGNSIAGVDLIRRISGDNADVLSTPLVVNKTTGVKFGKSEGGAVWLDEKKTSVYQFYQFWLNSDDAGVIDYAKVYTLLDESQLEALAEQQRSDPAARAAQIRLAQEVTDIVHGQQRRESVERVTRVLFGREDVTSLGEDELDMLAAEITAVGPGRDLVEILSETGLASSNGDAKRLIEGGAISVNGVKVEQSLRIDTLSLVKKGKNSFVLVR